MHKVSSTLMATAFVLTFLVGAAAASKSPSPAKHSNQPVVHALVKINMDLDFKPHTRSSFGKLQGYDPVEVHVHQNDRIQFVNVDDQTHTATGMSYTGQVVPAHYLFHGDPTKSHGRLINATEWSTGNVRAHGGKSQVFVAKTVGHYFYGCTYHLGNGMIGVIVVGP